MHFGEHKIPLKLPKNPTNILWINNAIPDRQRTYRCIIAIVFGALWLFFLIIILFVTLTEWRLYVTYANEMPGVVCEDVRERFGNSG